VFSVRTPNIEARSTNRARAAPGASVPRVAFDEGLVDDHLVRDRAQLRLTPRPYLLPHGLEVPLHPVNSDRDGVHQRKVLRVFC
jgi:hypothetical protein